MHIYNMDGKKQYKLFFRIRRKSPWWKKWKWIYYLSWTIILAVMVALLWYVYVAEGTITVPQFVLVIVLGGCPGIFVECFKYIMYQPVGEVLAPMAHTVAMLPEGFSSQWQVSAAQYKTLQASAVQTDVTYDAISKIVWNESLKRLEIHCEYQQKVKGYFGVWEEMEHVAFTRNKKEHVLHLYDYFDNMEGLKKDLETFSGHKIETI